MAYGMLTWTVQWALPALIECGKSEEWECVRNFLEAEQSNQTKSGFFFFHFKYLSLISIKFQNQIQ